MLHIQNTITLIALRGRALRVMFGDPDEVNVTDTLGENSSFEIEVNIGLSGVPRASVTWLCTATV